MPTDAISCVLWLYYQINKKNKNLNLVTVECSTLYFRLTGTVHPAYVNGSTNVEKQDFVHFLKLNLKKKLY